MADELKTVSFYLSKEAYEHLNEEAISDVIKREDDKGKPITYKIEHTFIEDGKTCCFLYVDSENKRSNPDWMNFINNKLNEENHLSAKGTCFTPKGVLLIHNQNKIFAVTFGYGGALLRKDKFIHDFGIKVAMNMCGNESIKQTGTSKQRYNTQHIARQTSLYSNINEFEVNDTDLLNYISAKLNDDVSIQGKSYVNINLSGSNKLSWGSLFKYTDDFLVSYGKKDYEKTFPFYASFEAVDNEKSNELDLLLLKKIKEVRRNNNKFIDNNIHLSIPEFIADDKYAFAFSEASKTIHMVISAENVFDEIQNKIDIENLTINNITNKKIYAVDKAEWRIFTDTYWTVYNCLVAEIEVESSDENALYVLSSGIWKKVSNDLYEKVQDFIRSIESNLIEVNSQYKNINIHNGKNGEESQNRESIFNEACSDGNGDIIMFDRTSSRIGKSGNKKYEFCDLLLKGDDGIEVVHVKQKSNNLDSIFKQARLYGEGFMEDQTFLDGIRDIIKKSEDKDSEYFLANIPEMVHHNNGNNYTVRLWLLYNKCDTVPTLFDLPFPSRYELREVFNTLRIRHKYKDVFISFVPVEMLPKSSKTKPEKLEKSKLRKK
jgi:uncharacterized protein (TIGR04141 family)